LNQKLNKILKKFTRSLLSETDTNDAENFCLLAVAMFTKCIYSKCKRVIPLLWKQKRKKSSKMPLKACQLRHPSTWWVGNGLSFAVGSTLIISDIISAEERPWKKVCLLFKFLVVTA